MGKLFLAAACLLLLQTTSPAQEPDEVAKKITAAKDAFYAERDKAEQALLSLLERKEAAAKQAGDVKTIEALRAETEAFRNEGKLPKSVSLTTYETTMKLARVKLENVYTAAIKSSTTADKLEEAKELQKELDDLRKQNKIAFIGKDPFQARSEWVRPDAKIVVTQRSGENFKAIYSGANMEREINGTIKDGKFEWFARDSRIIKGPKDKDHRGTIKPDGNGFKMSVTLNGGKFEMRLKTD